MRLQTQHTLEHNLDACGFRWPWAVTNNVSKVNFPAYVMKPLKNRHVIKSTDAYVTVKQGLMEWFMSLHN